MKNIISNISVLELILLLAILSSSLLLIYPSVIKAMDLGEKIELDRFMTEISLAQSMAISSNRATKIDMRGPSKYLIVNSKYKEENSLGRGLEFTGSSSYKTINLNRKGLPASSDNNIKIKGRNRSYSIIIEPIFGKARLVIE